MWRGKGAPEAYAATSQRENEPFALYNAQLTFTLDVVFPRMISQQSFSAPVHSLFSIGSSSGNLTFDVIPSLSLLLWV